MKKLLIIALLTLFFCPKTGKAQAYVPLVIDSTHWFSEKRPIIPVPPFLYAEHYLLGDTIVSTINYKKIYYRQEFANSYQNMVSPYSLSALIREDTLTRKVYAILLQNPQDHSCPLNQEVLLYDFSAQPFDTLKGNDHCLLLNDNIITGIIQNNFWLNSLTYSLNYSGQIYEGVGSYYGLLEAIYSSLSGPQFIMVDYCRGGLSNCKYYNVGVNNQVIENNIKIYPNPTNNSLTIETDLNYHTFNIYNLSGKLVKTQNRSNQISVSELPKGMYFIQLVGDKNNRVQKFIKE